MPVNQIKNFMWDEQYMYCIDPNVEEPIVVLLEDIGGFEISGAQVARELYNLDNLGKRNINIVINSIGGSVTDGMSIYTAIQQIKTPVTTYCGGFCLSIAAVIFLAGENRIMADYGNLMVHNPYNTDNSIDEGLERARLALIKMITKDKFDSDEIQELLKKETWMNAEEALEYGFATAIEKTIEKNKVTMLSKDKISAKHQFGNLMMNKFIEAIKNKNTNDMKVMQLEELESKMALNAVNSDSRTRKDYEKEEGSDAGDKDPVVNEGEEIMDSLEVKDEVDTNFQSKASDEEDCEMKNDDDSEIIDKDKLIDSLKDEMKNLVSELNSLKDAKAKGEKEARDKKVMEALRSFTKQGKIKDEKEIVNLWKAELERDFDTASKLINSFPVYKIAAKMDDSTKIYQMKDEMSTQDKMRIVNKRDLINKKK